MIKQVTPFGESLEVGTEYMVKADKYNMVLIAYANQGSSSTAFEFEYYVTGEIHPYYEKFFEYIKYETDPEGTLWGILVGFTIFIIIMGILIGWCICCCYQSWCKKKNKVVDENIHQITADP